MAHWIVQKQDPVKGIVGERASAIQAFKIQALSSKE